METKAASMVPVCVYTRSSAYILGVFVGLLTMGAGVSLTLAYSKDSHSYWVAFSILNMKILDLQYCILFCPVWLSLGGLLCTFLKIKCRGSGFGGGDMER